MFHLQSRTPHLLPNPAVFAGPDTAHSTEQKMAKRLVLFNYPGDVNNTTSIYELGWLMAEKHRVLLVDADPTCNLTSLILRDGFDEYYASENTGRQNLKDATSAAFKLDTLPIKLIECPSVQQAPNLHLLPGHPNLAEWDFYLMLAQDADEKYGSLKSTPGAFNNLIASCESKYNIDFTLINLGPGIGGINQNLFIHSDVFVVPTMPSPGSVKALEPLKYVTARWVRWKNESIETLEDAVYPLRPGTPKFGGMLIQRFSYRNGRTMSPHRQNAADIKSAISNDVFPHLLNQDMCFLPDQYPAAIRDDGYCLQEMDDFSALRNKAIEVGIPAFALSDAHAGEIGPLSMEEVRQRDHLRAQLDRINAGLTSLFKHV
ncbi:ParA family protein [Pandoraea aquatica]|nr:AAA family ATPase [Pandoraea aquatica]